ncbi:maleylpyruvate isomerase N-terminal domain-containing protein [Dactylosporangium sp. NPDC051541]|uniref:maleylpyruvate isomerase N-terminal domain-containing protein n=1 Tax=Dactylosporangium sp. NPDC051541 TaxID=3363977 RepID=UPI0037A994FD
MTTDALDAWDAETARLVAVLHDVPPADWARASPCPPWTAADLLGHVVAGVARVPGMLDAPAPPRAEIDAIAYFRADARFSGSTNAERIDLGQRLAAELGGPGLVARLTTARAEAVGRCRREPGGRIVRTRHGDAMLLTDFLATRVLEAGIHGLDLADALGREPWLTGPAAELLTRVYGAADRPGLRRLALG